MIPISSAKLNNKLANHTRKKSLFNESHFNKRSCVCLSIGMVFGLCLAGIFFYASLPNEEYRTTTKIKLNYIEGLRNETQNNSSRDFKLAQKAEQSTFPSTTVSLNNNEEIQEKKDESFKKSEEIQEENDEAE